MEQCLSGPFPRIGQGVTMHGPGDGTAIPDLLLWCKGEDNVITLHGTAVPPGRVHFSGSHHRLEIGDGCDLADSTIAFAGAPGIVSVGERTTMAAEALIQMQNGGRITIGADCRLCRGVLIGNSDGHAIFDAATGRRRNPDADVVIADRVCIESHARIAKGAVIGAGSVVGALSMATGEVPPDCYVTGIPARVAATGISWSV